MCRKQAFFPENKVTAGPYSPAITVGDGVYISGQGPISPESGQITGDSFEEQVELTFDNVVRALSAAGCILDDCIKVNVYLSDMSNFARFNEIYARKFSKPYPARTTIQAVLWQHIQIEIDAIGMRGCGGSN